MAVWRISRRIGSAAVSGFGDWLGGDAALEAAGQVVEGEVTTAGVWMYTILGIRYTARHNGQRINNVPSSLPTPSVGRH